MRHNEPRESWAWQSIESAADQSLEPDAMRRFLDAVADDRGLAAAYDRARAVHGGLKRIAEPAMPRGLLWRLWSIPGTRRATQSGQPLARRFRIGLAAPAAGAAAAAALALFLRIERPAVEPDPGEVAVEQFALAMSYLKRGADIANEQVRSQMRDGVLDALAVSREALAEDESSIGNGG